VFSARYDPSIQVQLSLRIKSAFRNLKQAITDLAVIHYSSFYKVILLLYTLPEHAVIPLAFNGKNNSSPIVRLMEFSDDLSFESLAEHRLT
jgi:hypothetical protein